ESLNAVHIIPSVATTLPFAEQMAKEREAEALEVSLHQPPNERFVALTSCDLYVRFLLVLVRIC
ncbi:hypothetical protein V3C99_009050, partial [Haemonchus contortus]